MSLILRKKKGLIVPKTTSPKGLIYPNTTVPTTAQILGSLGMGIGSVIGVVSTNKKDEMIKGLIDETIQLLIMEKMSLSKRSLKSIDYFVSYFLDHGEKKIRNLYIKKRIWFGFIIIDQNEMLASGAKPEEFVSFLKTKHCKKVKISKEQLENII